MITLRINQCMQPGSIGPTIFKQSKPGPGKTPGQGNSVLKMLSISKQLHCFSIEQNVFSADPELAPTESFILLINHFIFISKADSHTVKVRRFKIPVFKIMTHISLKNDNHILIRGNNYFF